MSRLHRRLIIPSWNRRERSASKRLQCRNPNGKRSHRPLSRSQQSPVLNPFLHLRAQPRARLPRQLPPLFECQAEMQYRFGNARSLALLPVLRARASKLGASALWANSTRLPLKRWETGRLQSARRPGFLIPPAKAVKLLSQMPLQAASSCTRCPLPVCAAARPHRVRSVRHSNWPKPALLRRRPCRQARPPAW